MEPTDNSNIYPLFEVNQVLSHTHLNQSFNYLDEQQRLTRADLIGIGIVCGLELSLGGSATEKTVTISRGCGITSQGHLIVEQEVVLPWYREAELNDNQLKDLLVEKPPVYGLWELFPSQESGTQKLGSDQNVTVSDKAVLLFLELKAETLANCTPDNCEYKGSKITVSVRRFLINKDVLKTLCACDLASFQAASLNTVDLAIPRIAFPTPKQLINVQDTYTEFFTLKIGNITYTQKLLNAIAQTYEALRILLPDLEGFPQDQLIKIIASVATADQIAIQYYYDLLKDLTAGYQELHAALLQRVPVCLPTADKFPRYLALGALDGSVNQELRTGYFSSPAVSPAGGNLEELGFLFNRLSQMVFCFEVPSATSGFAQVTPSSYGHRGLSGKAIPYYYNDRLREFWDASRRGARSVEILSWQSDHRDSDQKSPDQVLNPMSYDLEPYNFFRVEGIVGKSSSQVSGELDRVPIFRLPFSILYLSADKIGSFLDRHHAIEHQAGVLRGGTLVLLYRESGAYATLVVADFALPYRIENEAPSGHLGRVVLKEAGFEWFDSRKHLANLARREYRFAPRSAVHPEKNQKVAQESLRAQLAQVYVIRVYRYEVGGNSILGQGPVTVTVPISDLVSGQLSSIARALNSRFPNGVVFDHEPNTNKLLIRLFENHSFLIEWGGLQGNQIRYQYTDLGILRRLKGDWKLLSTPEFAVQWHPNKYRHDEYVWLHADSWYEAGYPTPAAMPSAQELITWEKMTKVRVPRQYSGLPIKDVLDAIEKEITSHYPKVAVTLVGSWATGSWVCIDATQNKFPAGFLALRQKVSGRTGVSDIDLLVDLAGQAFRPDDILATLRANAVIKSSGYKVNVIIGKRAEQKGLVLV